MCIISPVVYGCLGVQDVIVSSPQGQSQAFEIITFPISPQILPAWLSHTQCHDDILCSDLNPPPLVFPLWVEWEIIFSNFSNTMEDIQTEGPPSSITDSSRVQGCTVTSTKSQGQWGGGQQTQLSSWNANCAGSARGGGPGLPELCCHLLAITTSGRTSGSG